MIKDYEDIKKAETEELKINSRLLRGRKLTEYNHRGFAFDGEAGHDSLITDNLFGRVFQAINVFKGDAQLGKLNYTR